MSFAIAWSCGIFSTNLLTCVCFLSVSMAIQWMETSILEHENKDFYLLVIVTLYCNLFRFCDNFWLELKKMKPEMNQVTVWLSKKYTVVNRFTLKVFF